MVAEPSTGYLGVPDSELAFCHPAGGDACTVVTADEWLWPAEPIAGTAVRVNGAVELAHHRLVRAADGDAFEAAESLVRLLAAALSTSAQSTNALSTSAVSTSSPSQTARSPAAPGTGPREIGARRAAARLAADAAEAIAMDDPVAIGLVPLARRLGVSPSHLSRVFHRETGVTLTRYRNRVRVSRALDRLLEGEPNLAVLAAELGFADQAHLTRTVRAEVGRPPSALRSWGRAAPRKLGQVMPQR
jgi:AraC-like DNA-binding protein